MQVIVLAIFIIAVIAFIIYKVNKKFDFRELFILIVVVIVLLILGSMFSEKKQEEVPNIFKEKYEKQNNAQITKLSFERLNNKTVTSTTKFVYNLDYIVKKENKEFVCHIKNLEINKIEDELIFEKYKENCTEK